MKCSKCGNFPCTRKECDLKNGKCDFGKTVLSIVSENIEKSRKSKIIYKNKY